MLWSLGIPMKDCTTVFGDNLSILISSTSEGAELKKKHTALSFHMVREAVAAEIIAPHHIPGYYNYADILTKAVDMETFKRHAFNILVDNPNRPVHLRNSRRLWGGQPRNP